MDIIATINPWSDVNYIETVDNLYKEGIKILRINIKVATSKKDFEELFIYLNNIVQECEDIKFLLDIAYPKDTVRTFISNEKYMLEVDEKSTVNMIFFNSNETVPYFYPDKIYIDQDPVELKKGETIIYGDGDNLLKVVERISDYEYIMQPLISGEIWSSTAFHFQDAIFIRNNNFDLFLELLDKLNYKNIFGIALSFVENVEEIINIKKLINNNIKIISKIESVKAFDDIEKIVENSHTIMYGRGDMFFSIEKIEDLLDYQCLLNDLCIKYKKEYIVATDVLSSLERNILPTRADLIDLSSILKMNVDYITVSKSLTRNPNLLKSLNILKNIGL